MIRQRGQENRERNNLRRKYGFGDEVRVIYHGRRRARDSFLKQQPRQKPAEQPEGIVLRARALRRRLLQTDLKNKGPTDQQYQRLNQSPKPSSGRSHEALLEIPPHELK